jgi:hypothetical protein
MTLVLVADLVRVGLVAAAGAFLAAGDGPAALKTVLMLPPAMAGRLASVPAGFDLVFVLALAVEAVGTRVGADGWFGQGDLASHLVIPFLSAPIVFGLVVCLREGETRRATCARSVGAGLVTALVVLTLGAMWEVVEYAADGLLGTDYSQGRADTLSDLGADAVAAALGGAFVGLELHGAFAGVLGHCDYRTEGRRRREAA